MALPKRVNLYQALPLKTPFSFHVFPIHRCNFRCRYCLHSLPPEKLGEMKFKKEVLPVALFRKAIDDLHEFSNPLKSLIFAGHGEPLLHPGIAEMVSYARERNVADRVEIVTNASLLTHEMTDSLIAAGLDRLRISVQGLDAGTYRDIAGTAIDFDRFIDNIRFFFERKGDCDLYVKIIDMGLGSREEEFYRLFRPISDTAAVEFTIPFVREIDLPKDTSLDRAKQGHPASLARICSMPFYQIVLLPSGNVTGCCAVTPPVIYGNVGKDSLRDLWERRVRKEFLLTQLANRWDNPICGSCSVPMYGLQPGDELDPFRDTLLKKFRKEP
jgi:radical SAM protein with 4Fe4S-binding SPASM domain